MGLQQNDLAFNPGQVLPPKVNGSPLVNLCSSVSLFDNTSFSVLGEASQLSQSWLLTSEHQAMPEASRVPKRSSIHVLSWPNVA